MSLTNKLMEIIALMKSDFPAALQQMAVSVVLISQLMHCIEPL